MSWLVGTFQDSTGKLNLTVAITIGEMMAIMGPSGCGKTTLLNVLAHRQASAKAQVSSKILVNDQKPSLSDFRNLSAYVESEDALIGSLTVHETLYFAARLSLSGSVSAAERIRRVNHLMQAFGLVHQGNTIIGTLVKKGISTGQKRRTSVAAQLISAPKILFLDEPTSGLDSEASFNVISFIRDVVKANKLIVISSIHQPSTTTFELFDKLLLLSGGKTCYFGHIREVKPYFDSIGFLMPNLTNPADFMLGLTNIDFERDTEAARARIAKIQDSWGSSPRASDEKSIATDLSLLSEASLAIQKPNKNSVIMVTQTLLHRSWIKSRRDILVYGIRFFMYLGLAILMGTVWLRLPAIDYNMQLLANCIMFGSAFMSFMAVVYVPAFIEDLMVFQKDRANGLYGSTPFIISNFLIGLPWLFLIAFVSSTFVYWMAGFRPDGTAFMVWVMWMYLNLVAAESLVVLMSALFPNFVGALALTAMANGLWMACNGFMVSPPTLNVFYRYVFYYINYQAYVFRGLISNEFATRTYRCGYNCYCMYDTVLKDQCLVAGDGVMAIYGFNVGNQGKWVGIMLGIIAAMRLMAWAVMVWKK
jgi:ABC-type multidrug transport system ATPase subunit